MGVIIPAPPQGFVYFFSLPTYDPDMPIPRILVIDDEKKIHTAVEKALAGEDLRIDHAKDGKDALAKLGLEPCALIITDLVMPKKDGLSLVQTLRAQSFRMPIIVVSGYITEDLRRELTYSKDVSFLSKPFKPADLQALVRKLLAPPPA
jgi:DNA-binding response OmpR family regulator